MKKCFKLTIMAVLFFFVTAMVFEPLSYARTGGGRSSGGRSSSGSSPNSFSQQKSNTNTQSSDKGSLLKSIGGGIVGGIMGSMLFNALGFGGGGMGAMGGILQILIFAGIGYVIFRFIRSRTKGKLSDSNPQSINTGGFFKGNSEQPNRSQSGISAITDSDPSFNEVSFKDNVMDMFFKIQAAWMNRNLSSATDIIDDQMKNYLQDDIDKLISSGKINKLENIAVRTIDIHETWRESNSDCITVSIYANILDYTVDEKSGSIIEGSKTEPVKFEEYWTFFRTFGSSQWKLSAINQK